MKRYLLTSLLSVFMLAAFAEGEIYVSVSKDKVLVGETVDIIVNMKQDAEEVRNVECNFTMPSGLSLVSKSYNADRVDGFSPVLNIKNGGSASKVTFMSYSGDYIADTDGELFRFTVRANRAMSVDFDINYELAYGAGIAPTEGAANVAFDVDLVYNLFASEETVNVEGEGYMTLGFENQGVVAGFTLDITLPEGISLEKNSRGKVVWNFTDRADQARSVSENWIADNKVRLVVMGVATTTSYQFIRAGEGDVLSVKIIGAEDLPLESQIVIDNISFSDNQGNQYNQDGKVEVNVYNVALANKEALLAANQAAAEADVEKLEGYQTAISEAVAGNEEFVAGDTYQQIETLLGETYMMLIQQALDEANESGTAYVSPIDDEWWAQQIADIKAEIEANKAAAEAEAARQAANLAAAEADVEKLEGYQTAISEAVAGNEEYVAGDTYQQIETLLGETYMMLIQQALDEANENGTEYVSPIDDEWWAQQIADIKAEIAANKAAAEAEAARQAANLAAAEADMEKVEALQAELSAVISGNEEFISEEDNKIIEEFLGEKYPMEIQAALEAVAEEGEYVSPIDEDALRAIIETIKANIEAAKQALEDSKPKPGDINLDGVVNVLDYNAIRDYNLNGTQPEDEAQLTAGDMNGNGKIDMIDLQKVVLEILGTEYAK